MKLLMMPIKNAFASQDHSELKENALIAA